MATVVGTVYLNGCNYQLAYDLLSQDVANNYSTVRLYGILNVTNNYIAWSRGSASVHTSGLQGIGTYYGKGSHILISRDFTWYHDGNGNFSAYIGASLSTTFVSGDTGGVITLPHIDRSVSSITSYHLGPSVTDNITVNYTSTPGKEKKLRVSIPNVVQLQKFDNYSNGQTVKLSNDALNKIKQYASTSPVPIGVVIETWVGGTKLGESAEYTVNCSLGGSGKIRVNGQFKDATVYVRVNGQWKEAIPYVRVNNQWKEGI